jgi:hypothetical protein
MEEGLKDRPVVVVVAHRIINGRTQILVAPITHTKPEVEELAIALPQSVKRNLELDSEQSFIVLTELNQFIWPGPDVRPAPACDDGSPLYGAIPEWLFERVRTALATRLNEQRLDVTKRSS